MKHAIALSTLLTAACLWTGCDDAKPPVATEPPPATASALTTATTGPVQIEECLVCVGHEIKVRAKTPRTEYAGKTYYFCSRDCLAEFKKDPAKYAGAATTRPTTVPHDDGHAH